MEIKKKQKGADHHDEPVRAPLENRRAASTAGYLTFNTGTGGAVLRALAVLRGVRLSGKDKRGLRETIAAALEQGAAFKQWSDRGTPIRRVQVWVENHLVMTVSPEENSQLKAFNFDLPSPRDAVMRIVTADEGEKPIVLRNLPLNIVPPSGLDQTSELPNGQRIRLVIVPEEMGRYDIMVEFAAEEDFNSVEDRRLVAKAKTAAAGKRESGFQRGYVPTLLPQLGFSPGASACAFVILVLATIVFASVSNTSRGLRRDVFALASEGSGGKQVESSKPENSQAYDGEGNAKEEALKQLHGPRAYVTVTVPGVPVIESGNAKDSCRSPVNVGGAKEAGAWHPPADLLPHQTLVPPEPKRTIVLGLTPHSEPRVFASWDPKGLPKLASIRFVEVTVDNSPTEANEVDLLHRSFVRVLKDSAFWRVRDRSTDTKPDAVVNLKFDPDKTCLGVVVVNINDVEGNFLWQAIVSCEDLQKQGHEAMFAEASKRLINNLQNMVKLQSSAKSEPPNEMDAAIVAFHRNP